MLVLSRKENERIQIGDDIVVTVVRVGVGKVRIGIAAPDAVRIVRSELIPGDESHEEPTVLRHDRKLS